MLRFIFGAFFGLHSLVHLLYFSQSQRLFELRPGMVWPDGSWAFSRIMSNKTTRWLASISCIIAAFCFLAGGIGLLFGQTWWAPVVVGGAIFSTLIYILFWDGEMQQLDAQGGIALLINLAILIGVLLYPLA